MVEWKKLGEVCKLERGVRVVKKNLKEEGLIPVYQNSLTPLGYYDKSNYPEHTCFVICAGAAGEVGFSNKAFWAADDCTCVVCPPLIHSTFIYYYLMENQHLLKTQVRKASVPRLSKDVIGKLLLPIPSLSEQQRIVSILDTFTSSISNLKQQIEERRKQYEYERDLLLDLEGKEGVEMKKLGEVLQIKKGEYITKKEAKEGVYPVILGGKEPAYYIDRYNHVGKAIVISRSGASAGYVSFWNQPIFITDGFLIEPKENVLFEFLYYTLKSKQRELHGSQKGGAIPHVTPASISTIKSFFPPLSTQSRIVSILDTFEQSISNLEEQLAMREKQYEYYRNQLLTFEGEEERGKT